MRPISVFQVASYLAWASEQKGQPLTNLEILKLLYYAQGWHLALYDQPLFDAKIRAWKQGPVQPSVWHRYRHLGWHVILGEQRPEEVGAAVKRHLDAVLDVFGGCGPHDLRRMTHTEDPWIQARNGIPIDQPSNTEIPVDEMKRFFRQLLEHHHPDQRYEWSREALVRHAEEERKRFQETLAWVNENYGEALQRLAE